MDIVRQFAQRERKFRDSLKGLTGQGAVVNIEDVRSHRQVREAAEDALEAALLQLAVNRHPSVFKSEPPQSQQE